MSIEEAIARDLVSVLFVTFLFGGGVLWLIVASVAENLRKARVAERVAALKQSMVERGFRADEIVKVRFALPATGKIVEITARTKWVRNTRGTDAVGLEFTVVPPEVLETIEAYVNEMGGT